MDINSQTINSSSLVNILTLRYDPLAKSNLPKKNFQDFQPIREPPNIQLIEKSISENIEQKLETLGNQKICIADFGP